MFQSVSLRYFHLIVYPPKITFLYEVFEIKANAKSYPQKTGLEHLKNRTLSNDSLSGGEKQRLEIARALYHDSQLILADEIKANLDSENSRKISDLLFSLPQTVIEVIHHYTEEDLKHYDQVIHLSKEK